MLTADGRGKENAGGNGCQMAYINSPHLVMTPKSQLRNVSNIREIKSLYMRKKSQHVLFQNKTEAVSYLLTC